MEDVASCDKDFFILEANFEKCNPEHMLSIKFMSDSCEITEVNTSNYLW